MAATRCIVTRYPTPVFNTPDINGELRGEDGDTPRLDDNGHLRSLETILPKDTVVKVIACMQDNILRIQTEAYPYEIDLFIDRRFTKEVDEIPVPPSLPTAEKILRNLYQARGTPYLWGGSLPEGSRELHRLYPSKSSLQTFLPKVKNTWLLEGVDCSGLLYYATQGHTPRNTSSLVTYGEPVSIAGCSVLDILSKLRPLDLIVWTGHVVCVYSAHTCIESRHPIGVEERPLEHRLGELMRTQKRIPADDPAVETDTPCFVVRRWHPKYRTTS